MMKLPCDVVTIMLSLSIGVVMAVIVLVWARIVAHNWSCSPMLKWMVNLCERDKSKNERFLCGRLLGG